MLENSRHGSQIALWIQVALLVTTIATLVGTGYFSFRAERAKAITIRYYGERPLLSQEGRAAAGLQVSLHGEHIRSPWLLSGRVENTGNQPIEPRDIEQRLQLLFAQGRVVGADIAEKSQPAISASVVRKGNAVIIEHGLLNPGDWIGFDILTDGRPALPSVTLRVSGVSKPRQIIAPPGTVRAYVSVLPLPPPLLYLTLILASLIGLLTWGAGVTILATTLRDLIRPRQWPAAHWFDDPARWMSDLTPRDRSAKIILAAIGEEPSANWIDDLGALTGMIMDRVPNDLLQALELDANGAAGLTSAELKAALQRRLATNIFGRLPHGPDRAARDAVLKLDLHAMSSFELINRAMSIAEMHSASPPHRGSQLNKGDLVIGSAMLLGGLSLLLLLGGSWRSVLSM